MTNENEEQERRDKDADEYLQRARRAGARVRLDKSGLMVIRAPDEGDDYDEDGPYL